MADESNPNQVRENEPADLGYAPPDTGQGEDVESEVPEGVESLSEEQKQAAEERGGGDEGDDDGGALDVSEVMAEGGDDAEASAADDAGDDAEASAADDTADDVEGEGTGADDAGDDATEKTDTEAQVAPDTGEDT